MTPSRTATSFFTAIRIRVKVNIVANGQLLAHVTQGWPATGNFQRLVRPKQQTKTMEVTS
jgi:hypothetical protein